jgi:NADP-dependent 3-hydroxy acid dehydrogenase YdfG
MAGDRLGITIVTGGSSGLGAAVAAGVLEAGGRPIVLDRVEPAADVEHEVVDLGDAQAAMAAVTRAGERAGRIDAVVTAAGIDACGGLHAVPWDVWENVVRVNLLGTAAVVRAAMPWLEQGRGHVVTVASTLGLRALPDATAYCASKFGVVGFTRALAAETAGRVGVTLLVPGGMSTAFFDDRDERYRPPPDAVLNDPADVARSVVFALSQPPVCTVREMIVTPAVEPSWP